MIYTVTFNPAIDYVVHTDALALGTLNRAQGVQMYPGGKGINVSLVLAELGIPSKALGFVAGFTGRAIETWIAQKGVDSDFIHLGDGCSRINIKIKSDMETDLNGQGPLIPEEAVAKLYEKLDGLADGDILVLAGSIPDTLPDDIYEKILARLAGRGIKTVVDATKNLLLHVLKYKPFLVKPNHIELGEMFKKTLSTEEEILPYAKKLQEMGAANVLVSMAGDGAVLLDEDGHVHRCLACRGEVVNSVGAGDSMVAGFLAGLILGPKRPNGKKTASPTGAGKAAKIPKTNRDYAYALKLGSAAGGATAFSDGLAKREEIFALMTCSPHL